MSRPLVQYSDSESDDADARTPARGLKRKRSAEGQATTSLPPLPAAFHDLYSTNARASTTDDPSLHGGRKRAVPHIEGNWPSHVYIEYDREPFLEILTTSLRKAAVRPFNVLFTGLKWVPNYERNRWFLVLGIEKPAQDELNRLLNACNDAAERSGHPPLYVGGKGDGPMEDNTSTNVSTKRRKSIHDEDKAQKAKSTIDRTQNYHVSIAWNLTEPDPECITLAQDVDVSKFIGTPQTPFEVVKAKIGNVVHNIELDPRRASLGKRGGLLGLG
ncbi:poly(U)-specific 3'-to-5' RNA exonuclease [Paraconiothyrium brasiliense]|uniref:U6 snRNA phosphodiesterase 1 n=1 Tax=Paraconiothyrium brasiliense TaxID=300254 RepID=A0ABR3RHL8_9PLEO